MRWLKRHRHKWVEVYRSHQYWEPFGMPEGHRPGELTIVTERCADQSCRKWNQIRLMGFLPLTTLPSERMPHDAAK